MVGTASFPSTCSTCNRAGSSEDFVSRKSPWDAQVETGDGEAEREAGREGVIRCQGVLIASCPVPTVSSFHGQLGIHSVHVFFLLFQWRYQLPLLMQQYKPTTYQQLRVCWSFYTHAHSMHACRVKESISTFNHIINRDWMLTVVITINPEKNPTVGFRPGPILTFRDIRLTSTPLWEANQVVYLSRVSPVRWGWTRVGIPHQAFFQGWYSCRYC